MYLLKGENAPQCDTCNEDFTVRHMLEDCPKVHQQKRDVNMENSLEAIPEGKQ